MLSPTKRIYDTEPQEISEMNAAKRFKIMYRFNIRYKGLHPVAESFERGCHAGEHRITPEVRRDYST